MANKLLLLQALAMAALAQPFGPITAKTSAGKLYDAFDCMMSINNDIQFTSSTAPSAIGNLN